MTKIKNVLLIWILPVMLIILWFLETQHNWVNQSVLPSPQKVWASLYKLIQTGIIWQHIGSSVSRVLKGYAIGAVSGILSGTFVAISKNFEKITEVLIGTLRPIPAIALIPFFILWMGIGEESKVAVIVFGSFWPILLNTVQGIKSVDHRLVQIGEILEKKKNTILFRIIFPASLPSVLTGLRLGFSSAWTCVVAAEMIAASKGVGFLITYSREMAQPATLLIGVAIIGLFGMLIDIIFKRLNKRLVFWEKANANKSD